MGEITAKLVKELREITDAGMMDCKNALVEVGGDIKKAIEFLREKGLSKAAKKADRVAGEGVISIKVSPDFKKGSLLEINSETDFVAKNDGFMDLVNKSTELVFGNVIKEASALESHSIDGQNFSEYLKTQIAKIGENIVVRRIASFEVSGNQVVNAYLHHNKRIGVLINVKFKNEANREKVANLGREICMHIAAMKPQFLDSSEFSKDFIEKEKIAIKAELEKENEELARLKKPLKTIPEFISKAELSDEVIKNKEAALKEELKKQGKPEAIWDKIIPGQLDRFKADSTILDQRLTLLGQFFIMDDKKTIAQVLEQKSKELNDEISVVEYIRFELGEGVEKKAEDFAAEVAAQMA